MFAVRRAVARVPARSVLRRGYADVADDKLKLSLVMPHKVRGKGWRLSFPVISSWRETDRCQRRTLDVAVL